MKCAGTRKLVLSEEEEKIEKKSKNERCKLIEWGHDAAVVSARTSSLSQCHGSASFYSDGLCRNFRPDIHLSAETVGFYQYGRYFFWNETKVVSVPVYWPVRYISTVRPVQYGIDYLAPCTSTANTINVSDTPLPNLH